MKGIILVLLERCLAQRMGIEAYEAMKSDCSLQTREPFTAHETYPDGDLFQILLKAAGSLSMTVADLLRLFGEFSFPILAEQYPVFVHPYRHPKPFLQSVEKIIHVEVHRLYPDAETPTFTYRDPAHDRLIIEYASRRKMCHFMEGLLKGVASYFGCPIQVLQTRCIHSGDPVCEFDLVFGPASTPPQKERPG